MGQKTKLGSQSAWTFKVVPEPRFRTRMPSRAADFKSRALRPRASVSVPIHARNRPAARDLKSADVRAYY